MFVLLFGLMGVAAIFPVGNHYAGKGEQYDRGAALADQAFADLKARGLFNPSVWLYPEAPTRGLSGPLGVRADGADQEIFKVIQPTTLNAGAFNIMLYSSATSSGPGHAFVLDPMGVAAALSITTAARGIDVFPFALCSSTTPDGVKLGAGGNPEATNLANPAAWGGSAAPLAIRLYGKRWPIRRVTVPSDNINSPSMKPRVAESLCSLHDDLSNETPDADDRPGVIRFAVDGRGTKTAADDIPLARDFTGGYSWIATIVPTSSNNSVTTPDALQAMQPFDSSYGTYLYDVSVAVIHRRELPPSAASERAIDATLTSENELALVGTSPMIEAALKDIRQGQWIALAGVHPTSGVFLLKWYKLLSLDAETGTATLDGPKWPENITDPRYPVQNLRAILLPGVVGVSTQTLPIDMQY